MIKLANIEQWQHCKTCGLCESEISKCKRYDTRCALTHTCFAVYPMQRLLCFDVGVMAYRFHNDEKIFISWFPDRSMAKQANFPREILYADCETGKDITL